MLFSAFGFLKTLAILIALTFFGFFMAARNLGVLRRSFAAMSRSGGAMPAGPVEQLTNAGLLVASVPLYALPGVVTTIVAVLISSPLSRRLASRILSARLRARIDDLASRSFDNYGDNVRIFSFGPGFGPGFGPSAGTGFDTGFSTGFDGGAGHGNAGFPGANQDSPHSRPRVDFSFGAQNHASPNEHSLNDDVIDAEFVEEIANPQEFEQEITDWLDQVSPEDFAAGDSKDKSQNKDEHEGGDDSRQG